VAAASSRAFSFITPSIASPAPPTGWAAPVFVPGAIAATSAAISRKKPADAARAPLGPTQTTTGTGEARIALFIARVESSSPPGVSSSTTRAAASVRSASARLSTRNCSAIGWMMLRSGARSTAGSAAAGAGIAAQASSRPRANRVRNRGVIDKKEGLLAPQYTSGPPPDRPGSV